MKLKYIDLYTTDPYYNLACEQHIFDDLPADCNYLMLWQNDNAIVIGKYQNTYAEINPEYVRQRGIKVARRLSGGGAVYHDLGNLNYTIITDAADVERLNIKLFCEPVVRALKTLGVDAEIGGRNDIMVEGMKFSGNSQYIKGGRVMHHGTIMFDSDLDVLAEALRVDAAKIEAKGIKSVRSRVTNVKPYLADKSLTLSDFRRVLLREMISGSEAEEYELTGRDIEEIEKLRPKYEEWEWNFGKSPECTMLHRHRFEGCGTIEAYITVKEAKITEFYFHGDFFSAGDPRVLAEMFIGLRPVREDYEALLSDIDLPRYFMGVKKEEFVDFLVG